MLLHQLSDATLKLDDPISEYIPGVPSGDQITLREMTQMQSGLTTYDDVTAFTDTYIADPHQSFTTMQMAG